jgi:hypothetical protein
MKIQRLVVAHVVVVSVEDVVSVVGVTLASAKSHKL